MALSALDSGNDVVDRQSTELSLFINICSLSNYPDHLSAKQKEQVLTVEKGTLDYLSTHRQEIECNLVVVRSCIRSLRKFLTASDDIRRLDELSDYFSKQKPAIG